jgi:hypothetical protein
MQNSLPANNDPFIQALQHAKEKLEACQKEKQRSADIPSCYTCDQLLNCETRNTYVKAVYESMSKGETGGFEF